MKHAGRKKYLLDSVSVFFYTLSTLSTSSYANGPYSNQTNSQSIPMLK